MQSNCIYRVVLIFKKSFLFCLGVSFLAQVWAHQGEASKPFQMLHVDDALESHAHFGWESRYILEGRDSLAGGSLWSSSVEASYDHIFGGLWYGRSSSNDFRELHLGLGLKQEIGNFECYLAYTYLLFPAEDTSDSEWGLGLSYDALPFGMDTGLDLVYSVDAGGTFIEWSLSKPFEVVESWESSLGSTLGWNEEFVSDGHNGLNHFSLNASGQRSLTEHLGLVLHAAQSWAIDRDLALDGDASLKDVFHFGLSLEAEF